jgi:hypothetical protein
MFGSYYAEFALGLVFLAVAAGFWVLLLRIFHRPVVPAPFRGEMVAQISTVLEITLLAFGVAAILDALVNIIP